MKVRALDGERLDRIAPIVSDQRVRVEAADERLPVLPDSGPVTALLRRILGAPGAFGHLAEKDGRAVAYLIGVPVSLAPEHPMANFRPLSHAMLDFGVAGLDEAAPALFALYERASRDLVRGGFPIHYTHGLAAESPVLDLWSDLGFGRVSAFAAAELGGLPGASSEGDGLVVRHAARTDASLFRRLFEVNQEWHAGPPMFHAGRPEAIPAFYAALEEEMEDPRFAHLVAERDGRAVGICEGHRVDDPEPWNAHMMRAPAVFLNLAAVLPEAHGTGVGRALVGAFYDWARSLGGLTRVYLNYVTANPASSRFWTRQGFRPVAYEMRRVIPREA